MHLSNGLLGEFWTIKVVVISMADVIITSEMSQMTHFGQFLTIYDTKVWCFLMSNDQGNLSITIQMVKISFFALKFTMAKITQNGLSWPILGNFWSVNVQVWCFLIYRKTRSTLFVPCGGSIIRFSPFAGSKIWQNGSKRPSWARLAFDDINQIFDPPEKSAFGFLSFFIGKHQISTLPDQKSKT